MRTFYKARIIVAFLSLVVMAQSAQAVQYHLTNLGTLTGDNFSYAYAVNDNGQVAGMSNPIFVSSSQHAFLYSGSTMTNLGKLSGYTDSVAFGINNSGQIVGISFFGSNSCAFLYSGSTLNNLGIPSGFTLSNAGDINNNGVIAGGASYVQQATGKIIGHAFINNGSTWTDLGVPAGYLSSSASAINASGQVAGSASTSGSISHAFFYNGSAWTDLGTLYNGNPSSVSGAADINDNGLIVGSSSMSNAYPSHDSHAFLYNGSSMVDLGVLQGTNMSVANAINNHGQIVGESFSDATQGATQLWTYHAFIYEGSTMTDLNTLLDAPIGNWSLNYAWDINDNGQIVGQMFDSVSLHSHAFLLTPVPEPSYIAIVLTGAVALLAHWRLRRE